MTYGGNVKIPNLVQAGAMKRNSSGWIPISNGPVNTTSYTSLLGVPMTKKFAPGNTTFLMETSYVAATCLNRTSEPPITIMSAQSNYTNGTLSVGFGVNPESLDRPNFSIALNGFNGNGLYQDGALNSSNQPPTSATDERILLV